MNASIGDIVAIASENPLIYPTIPVLHRVQNISVDKNWLMCEDKDGNLFKVHSSRVWVASFS